MPQSIAVFQGFCDFFGSLNLCDTRGHGRMMTHPFSSDNSRTRGRIILWDVCPGRRFACLGLISVCPLWPKSVRLRANSWNSREKTLPLCAFALSSTPPPACGHVVAVVVRSAACRSPSGVRMDQRSARDASNGRPQPALPQLRLLERPVRTPPRGLPQSGAFEPSIRPAIRD